MRPPTGTRPRRPPAASGSAGPLRLPGCRDRRPVLRAFAPALPLVLAVLACAWLPPGRPAVAAPAPAPELLRVRHWTADDHTRIVLDLSGRAAYVVGPPARSGAEAAADSSLPCVSLAIEFVGVTVADTAAVEIGDGRVLRVRPCARTGGARVEVDLPTERPLRHFALAAADGRPDRVVIDLLDSAPGGPALAAEAPAAPASPPAQPDPRPRGARPAAPSGGGAGEARRPFTVVLDPGHGGLDPGAVRSGVREKDVALSVTRKVAELLNALPGYRAVLTREGDYFVSLARRVRTAREQEGDLFLSIHANTHPQAQTAGMEVYFLSLEGASDREAQELADKENAADLVGLAADERRDDAVLSILMDLRMSRVLNRSSALAERILKAATARELGTRRVKQARFQVLRSLAMPGVLVELAYLSNAKDRALLVSADGQRRLAETVVEGILRYREDSEALAVLAAGVPWGRQYRVQRGDTLWALARRHRTTVEEIRQRNNLGSGALVVGQHLRLPVLDP